MRAPKVITFTGVDKFTDLDWMTRISRKYRSQFTVEWGVLFSANKEWVDSETKYPDPITRALIESISPAEVSLAAHLCGGYARAVTVNKTIPAGLNVSRYSRFQVNTVNGDPNTIPQVFGIRQASVILQTKNMKFPDNQRVMWLFDRSGGKGKEQEYWPPHPSYARYVGYAGGLGPHNIISKLRAINSTGPYWIDMEGQIRTDDKFDLAKCEEVCSQVAAIQEGLIS